MKIVISSAAQDDLLAGYHFYDEQEQGIGDYFIDSLFAEIDSLILYAGIHPIVNGFYRLLAMRFPFAIYHKIQSRTVRIGRVLDCRQSPARIKSKINK